MLTCAELMTSPIEGNQPNYGNGATYWSYGREDNGSLPLDMLSVDEALLGWGLCDEVLDHVDFYFSNYIGDDGKTIYGCCGWPAAPDSLSDYGRLVDFYIRTVQMCDPPDAWVTKQLAPVTRIAQYMLDLHSTASSPAPPSPAPSPGPPPPCTFAAAANHTYIAGWPAAGPGTAKDLASAQAACALVKDCQGITFQSGAYEQRSGMVEIVVPAGYPDATSWRINDNCHPADASSAGLVLGAPEHDWSGTTNLAFYNNNCWLATGMLRIGKFMVARGGSNQAALGVNLVANGTELAAAVLASLKVVSQFDNVTGKLLFVPSYAKKNVTPYPDAHSSFESSYTNFRFYSETLMADLIPPEIEATWLDWHNNKGGRIGGANRFEGWMDDMPTAGWGYGALANNNTEAFLALLYGHMATYQSPGTFHSTEQLSFTGNGRYRDFLHIGDPVPGEGIVNEAAAFVDPTLAGGAYGRGVGHPMYNGIENDISFCVVSNILVARMSRWQLVFEDRRATSATVYLGRGAPQRWFRSEGFNVSAAPTTMGKVSYKVEVLEAFPANTTDPAGTRSNIAQFRASYTVDVSAMNDRAAWDTNWGVKWPGKLGDSGADCLGCTVEAQDLQLGLVKVKPEEGVAVFTVSAQWSV